MYKDAEVWSAESHDETPDRRHIEATYVIYLVFILHELHEMNACM